MAPTDHTLEQEFAQVVRDYFPRWRSAAHWTVTAGAGLRWQDSTGAWQASMEMGMCDQATRTITIARPEPSLSRSATIIHECCHAVTDGGHGQRWRARLQQAATRATGLGVAAVAATLLSQMEWYAAEEQREKRCPRILSFATRMQMHVADMVQRHPDRTFDAIIDETTTLLSYPRHLFLARIPTLPRVYDRAHARLKAGVPARPIPRCVWDEDEEDGQED